MSNFTDLQTCFDSHQHYLRLAQMSRKESKLMETIYSVIADAYLGRANSIVKQDRNNA